MSFTITGSVENKILNAVGKAHSVALLYDGADIILEEVRVVAGANTTCYQDVQGKTEILLGNFLAW